MNGLKNIFNFEGIGTALFDFRPSLPIERNVNNFWGGKCEWNLVKSVLCILSGSDSLHVNKLDYSQYDVVCGMVQSNKLPFFI